MTSPAVRGRLPAIQSSAVRHRGVPGNGLAFGELYRRHSRSVYNLVLRSVRDPHQAEDLCQEIWFKAYRELDKLRDPAAFPGWLYRITLRACIGAARKRSRVPSTTALTDEQAGSPSGNANPETIAAHREAVRLMWEALGALPPRQHTALFLKEVEGRTYREIAHVLRTSESAVETLLFRARRGLAEAYEHLQRGESSRCQQARRAMAALVDREATSVQRAALKAHTHDCLSCRHQVAVLRNTSAAYVALPLLSAPAIFAPHLAEAAGLAASGGDIGFMAKLIALATTKAKPLLLTLTVSSGAMMGSLVPGSILNDGTDSTYQGSHPSPLTNNAVESAAPEGALPDAMAASTGETPSGAIPSFTDLVRELREEAWVDIALQANLGSESAVGVAGAIAAPLEAELEMGASDLPLVETVVAGTSGSQLEAWADLEASPGSSPDPEPATIAASGEVAIVLPKATHAP